MSAPMHVHEIRDAHFLRETLSLARAFNCLPELEVGCLESRVALLASQGWPLWLCEVKIPCPHPPRGI
jgi:hypothetical protein